MVTDPGVGSWIERRARTDPHRPALIAGARTWRNAELAERIRRLAQGLLRLGLRPGDRVVWVGPNHPAFLEMLFASAQLGAVVAPVNHRLDPGVIAATVSRCEPRVVFRHVAVPADAIPRQVRAPVVLVRAAHAGGPDDNEELADPAGGVDVEVLVASSPADPVAVPLRFSDVCLLPHTSGTTGSPKAVMLTHGNITWNALSMIASTDLRPDDVTVAIAPFFRVGGTGVNVLPVLLKGGCVVVPESTAPAELLHVMSEHRVTVGFANPDLLEALTRSPQWPNTDLSALRHVVTGGAPVPERLLRAFAARGVPCLQGYGLSEAGPVVSLLPPEYALDRLGSAGQPIMFVDVRVMRPEGTECGPGETGELLVRGPAVMAGYWRNPEATVAALDREGWLHTGDAARADADGFVWIVDRMRDAYVTSGGTVYPEEVDRVLLDHPDVRDAAAAGVSTSGGSAETRAFVVPETGREPSQDALIAWCRERLPAHAVPVRVTFVESIPRNTVGKVVRAALN